jgi:hypothetical protein
MAEEYPQNYGMVSPSPLVICCGGDKTSTTLPADFSHSPMRRMDTMFQIMPQPRTAPT